MRRSRSLSGRHCRTVGVGVTADRARGGDGLLWDQAVGFAEVPYRLMMAVGLQLHRELEVGVTLRLRVVARPQTRDDFIRRPQPDLG